MTVAGNPVLSTPNGGALDRALEQLDFMVAIDIYVNETTRHADIILPPTTGLECDHYDVVFHVLAMRNTAKFSPALFEPRRRRPPRLADLPRAGAAPLRLRERPFDDTDPRNLATPAQTIDLGLRTGPYGGRRPLARAPRGAPHGVDLGPLEPLPARAPVHRRRQDPTSPRPSSSPTSSARVSSMERRGGQRHPALIGRRDLRSNNSWMHNSERLVEGRDAAR